MLMGGCINPFIGPTIGEAEVEGRVLYKDKLNSDLLPLPNALVTLSNSLENTNTDGNGSYKLKIRFRVGNLAKSSQATLTFYHEFASGNPTQSIIIKDGFTTVVPSVQMTLN